MTVLGRAPRVVLGALLLWCVGLAATAPEMSGSCAIAAATIFAASLWRPGWGLLLLTALAPAAAILAAPPVRAAEFFGWTLLAAWLLRVWAPLAPSWPRAITIPALLYGAALIASWLRLSIGGAAGVSAFAMPLFLLHSIPTDHLVFSSPEPETWTLLQSSTGIAIFIAACGITRDDTRLIRYLTWVVVASAAVLSLATLIDIVVQSRTAESPSLFLLRYVQGERFSFHLADLNAAGSLYVLGAVAAAGGAMLRREQRFRWAALFLLLMPALWLTGSRTSYVALLAGFAVLWALQPHSQAVRHPKVAGAILAVVMIAATVVAFNWETEERGSAGRAVNLRSQFSVTSARMFVSSPLFGVGIGHYFDRSADFMPDELRQLYGNENAHNYFAQQFAELGVVGGALFVWLVAASLAAVWTRARRSSDYWFVGLSAGTAAYLLTCVTGHPLLVPEAALPFWAAFGALAGVSSGTANAASPTRLAAAAASLLLLLGVGLAAAAYSRTSAMPAESGFHGLEMAADGTQFRWMTRHGVTYAPSEPGFIRLRVRAEERTPNRPILIETAVAGRPVDRREVPPGRWMTYDIAASAPIRAPFRRVDLRVNQVWTQEVRLGRRRAFRPVTLMVAEIRWIPLK